MEGKTNLALFWTGGMEAAIGGRGLRVSQLDSSNAARITSLSCVQPPMDSSSAALLSAAVQVPVMDKWVTCKGKN